jgi:hypothetical protein
MAAGLNDDRPERGERLRFRRHHELVRMSRAVLEADEAAVLTGERSPLPCFRWRRGVGDGCGGGAGEVGLGYPTDPERRGLLDTRYFWVSLMGIDTTIFVLGIGSLGRPNEICILTLTREIFFDFILGFSSVTLLRFHLVIA